MHSLFTHMHQRFALALTILVVTCTVGVQADSTTTKVRLSDAVNSFQPVVYPVLSYDGKRLYFSRKFHPENIGSTRDPDDVWYCEKNSQDTWLDPMNCGSVVNSAESNVLCSISPTDNTALFETTRTVQQLRRQSYSLSRLENSQWSAPRQLDVKNLHNFSKNFYAHLSFNQRVLFLALQTENSVGGLDLYVSFRLTDTSSLSSNSTVQFSEPINLGKRINTDGTEGSPCLAFDEKTLYFSSDGHGGFGNQDLFVSRRLDSSWTNWSEPENLGAKVNTKGLDHCFTLCADGLSAYIVSQDDSTGPGVYQITIPTEKQMGPSVVVKDSLKNVTNTSIKALDMELHFPTNSWELQESELESLLSELKNRPQRIHLRLDGYADSTGTEAINETLSRQRVNELSRQLRARLDSGHSLKITSVAHGGRSARYDNSTEEGRAKNRSVRVRIESINP